MKLNIQFPADYQSNGYDKVAVIKSLRGLTGIGLKEAKDFSETNGGMITVAQSAGMLGLTSMSQDAYIEDQCRILRNNGCTVNGSVHQLLQSLRDLGAEALKQGEDELASEILQLVLAEKLRKKQSET